MSGFLDKTGLAHLWEKMKSALSDKQDKLTAGTGIDIVDNTVSAKSATADEAGIVKIGSEVNTADDETALSTARFKSAKTSLETTTKVAMKVYYGTSTNSSNIATVSLNLYSTLVSDFSYPSPIGKILCVKFANASKARTTSSLKVQNVGYTIVGGESVGMWSAGDIAVFVVISSTQVVFIGSQTTAMSGNPFGTTKVHIPHQSNVEITDMLKVNCVNSNNELIVNYAFTKMTVHQFVFEGKSGAFADVSFIITGYNSSYSQGNFAVRAWCKIPSDKTATTVRLYPYAIQPVKSTIVSQALMYYITSDTIDNFPAVTCQII